MNHNELVKTVSEELISKGFLFDTELPLPKGKGATDISCLAGKDYIFHAEVKQSPATVNQKKVRKQLEKYKAFFAGDSDYILISPSADGGIMVQDLGGQKYNFKDYICSLK